MNKKLKILYLITKGEVGGAQVFVESLAKSMKAKGHLVDIAVGEKGDYLREDHLFRFLKRSSNPIVMFLFIIELYFFLSKNSYNVVHLNSTNTLWGAFVAKLVSRKIKTVFTIHGLSILDNSFATPLIIRMIFLLYFRMALWAVDHPVWVSLFNKISYNNKLKIKGKVILNGIESIKLKTKEEAKQFFKCLVPSLDLGSDFIMAVIARISAQKNHSFLIQNFDLIEKQYPNVKLLFIGDGPLALDIKESIEINKLQNKIFLVGEHHEINTYLKGIDLLLLPSLYEGLSIVLLEAQLAQINVLASMVGGNPEVVGENNCFHLNRESFQERIQKPLSPAPISGCMSLQEMADSYELLYLI